MPGLRIVLVRPKKSENVGAAARAMKNFGLDDLVLVNPRCRIDERAHALAVHAGDLLERALVLEDVPSAIRGKRIALGTTARERRTESFTLHDARSAATTYPGDDTAVLFGPEDFGLSNEDLDHCSGYIRIPTAEYASLNLAQAVQLVAYEWFLARHEPPPALPHDLAPREDLEGMYAQLLDVLHLIGYTDEQRHPIASRMFRGIFDRASLTDRELLAVRGLWRQVRWAAEQEPHALPGRRPGD